jgi:RNA polymerase sigma-70 factor (ECF subfamily)
MRPNPEQAPLDPWVLQLVRNKARKLARNAGRRHLDRADLEQEFLLHLTSKAKQFDPARGEWHAFAMRVLERYAANLQRDLLAEKRDPRRVCSLHAAASRHEDADSRAQHVGQRSNDDRRLFHDRDDLELAQLRLDVRSVLASLPSDLHALAVALMEKPLAQVARDWGVPRSRLYALVYRLQARCVRAGLDKYC